MTEEINVGQECREIYSILKNKGLIGKLKGLKIDDNYRLFIYGIPSWIVIFGSVALVVFVSWWFIPLALFIMGGRQRAFGVLLHDGVHYLLCKNKPMNLHGGNIFFGFPILDSFKTYQRLHFAHHAHLGSPRDPDVNPEFIDTILKHQAQRAEDRGKAAWRVYIENVFSWGMFRSSILTNMLNMSNRERLGVLLWWLVVPGLCWLVAGPAFAICFVCLWFGAKITVYHLVKVFAELTDHVWQGPKSIMGYTRTNPDSFLSYIMLNPHHDSYHIAHHLFPLIPLHLLKESHRYLMEVDSYANAQHCTSYFSGPKSVIASWTGTFDMAEEQDRH